MYGLPRKAALSLHSNRIKDAAGGATNTVRPLTQHLSKQKEGLLMNSIPAEQWLPIVGWEGLYEVSDQGRIRSLDREVTIESTRTKPFKAVRRGRVLVPLYGSGYSYPRVQLCRDGVIERHRLHRLVTQAFLGDCPARMVVCHDNDDRTDNRLSNLRYGTHSDNMFDSVRNGIHNEATKTHCKRGHEFTSENTYIYPPTGARRCRSCKRLRRTKACRTKSEIGNVA